MFLISQNQYFHYELPIVISECFMYSAFSQDTNPLSNLFTSSASNIRLRTLSLYISLPLSRKKELAFAGSPQPVPICFTLQSLNRLKRMSKFPNSTNSILSHPYYFCFQNRYQIKNIVQECISQFLISFSAPLVASIPDAFPKNELL